MLFRIPLLISVLNLFLIACQNTEQNRDAIRADTTSQGPDPISNEAPDISIPDPSDTLRQRINSSALFLLDSGFDIKEVLITKNEELREHWWLKAFFKRKNVDTTHFPANKDWAEIQSIRQFNFERGWKVVIEEWQLSDHWAARKWLDMAIDNKRLDNFKPPRVFWVEDDKLYFIMATSAQYWNEYGETLISNFSGRTRFSIDFFNRPFDPKGYKRLSGANSGVANDWPYLIKPDTIGTYFNYFWFHKLRQKYREKSFQGLNVRTYIFGEEIGYYNEVEEELIGVKSQLEDPDLGLLNLVGKDKAYLLNNLGSRFVSIEDLIIYQHNGDLLILHLMDDRVDWFNYLRTTLKIESGQDLPAELKYYSENVPRQSPS